MSTCVNVTPKTAICVMLICLIMSMYSSVSQAAANYDALDAFYGKWTSAYDDSNVITIDEQTVGGQSYRLISSANVNGKFYKIIYEAEDGRYTAYVYHDGTMLIYKTNPSNGQFTKEIKYIRGAR